MVRNHRRFFLTKDFQRDSLGLNEPGIFRRTASIPLIKFIQDKYNDGLIKFFKEFQPFFLSLYRSTGCISTIC